MGLEDDDAAYRRIQVSYVLLCMIVLHHSHLLFQCSLQHGLHIIVHKSGIDWTKDFRRQDQAVLVELYRKVRQSSLLPNLYVLMDRDP